MDIQGKVKEKEKEIDADSLKKIVKTKIDNRKTAKIKIIETVKYYLPVMAGSAILAFGIFNIHEKASITEGGVLGMILFLKHWFNISPAIASPIMDTVCYILGFKYLGKKFIKSSIVATSCFAFFYFIIERIPIQMFPDLSGVPVVAAVVGGIFVGVGVGLVVRRGGASGGDDALALVINHVFKLKLSLCYLFTDLVVLLLSLNYIPVINILYSLITVATSSFLIDFVQKVGVKKKEVKL